MASSACSVWCNYFAFMFQKTECMKNFRRHLTADQVMQDIQDQKQYILTHKIASAPHQYRCVSVSPRDDLIGCDGCGGWYHIMCVYGETKEHHVQSSRVKKNKRERWECMKCKAEDEPARPTDESQASASSVISARPK